MRKLLVFLFLGLAAGAHAENPLDWPVDLLPVGCTASFEVSGRAKSGRAEYTITEHGPFPQVGFWYERIKKVSVLSADTEDGGYESGVTSPFCPYWCSTWDSPSNEAQLGLFPFEVGKEVRLDLDGLILRIKVLEERSSPYIDGTVEFRVETHGASPVEPDEQFFEQLLWWNTDLGFYTERILARGRLNETFIEVRCNQGMS